MKDNDLMKLAYKIRALFHHIEATSVKVDLQLTTFIKALYPTYSLYLESLQSSEKMKDITFEKLVENIAEREKAFEKKDSLSNIETLCLAQKQRGKHPKMSLPNMTAATEVMEEDNLEAGGIKIIKVIDNILSYNTSIGSINKKRGHLYSAIDVEKWVIVPIFVELHGRRFVSRRRSHHKEVTLLNLHIML